MGKSVLLMTSFLMLLLVNASNATIAAEFNGAISQAESNSSPEALPAGDLPPVIIPIVPPINGVPSNAEPSNIEPSNTEESPLVTNEETSSENHVDTIFSSDPIAQRNEDSLENVLTLGQPSDAPFVVAIPGSREERLDRLQDIVPQAFLTDSRRGRYIQAGAFSSRSDAEALSAYLRHQGFDARVVYFRVR
ncbi:MAG: SPOR domain-containing protein [Cyanobacteria bacterium P01_A01_bin.37]